MVEARKETKRKNEMKANKAETEEHQRMKWIKDKKGGVK